jgi:IS605 OrfB family transposase
MELVKSVKCKLQVDDEGKAALLETIQRFADACNYVLQVAREHRTSNKVRLQHLCYHVVREQTGLSANLTIRAIARVAAKLKLRRKPTRFWPSSVDYDQRIFRMREIVVDGLEQFEVTLTTTRGAKRFPLRIGNYQRSLLKGQKPTAAVLTHDKRKRAFYVHIVLSTPMPAPRSGGQIVGIDLGIKNLATTSNGLRFSGSSAIAVRKRYAKLRQILQSNASRGAKALLRRLSGREHRYMTWVNHTISHRIVSSLQPGDTIVLEDLTYIREHIRVQRQQRLIQHSWAFAQLQGFIKYKALEHGINVIFVDPRYSSQICSRCDTLGIRQGLSFRCDVCGYRNHADFNAAYNLSLKGHALSDGLPVTQPISACVASAHS